MMTETEILAYVQENAYLVGAATVAGVAGLLGLAWIARRVGRGGLATNITNLAAFLGLTWSATGMYEVAVTKYGQDRIVSAMICAVFEVILLSRMLKAKQYREDLPRRSKHVSAVWTIAVIMALVVALGEGLVQAPARLSIPLLVTYGWWVDLTSADDPDEKLNTSWIWTPRAIGIRLGLLRAGAKDAHQVDHDNRVAKLRTLARRIETSPAFVNVALGRVNRLAALEISSTDEMIAAARESLARVGSVRRQESITVESMIEVVEDAVGASQPIEPGIDWQAEFEAMATEVPAAPKPLPVPVSPAPVSPPPRATRSRADYDVRRVAELVFAGATPGEIIASVPGLTRTPAYRLVKVGRILATDPGASISPAEKVAAEHVEILRDVARTRS